MEKQYLFGPEHFEKWCDCGTYPIYFSSTTVVGSLVDHGFIADRACIWGRDNFYGHELVVVSRTYCHGDVIDHPPDGLKCVRLPGVVMGQDDLGTAIATTIVGDTAAAHELLNMGVMHLPAHMLPIGMIEGEYCIALETDGLTDIPTAHIVKKSLTL